ncbi:MAG: Cna B-type domain-containing protein, partial [Clostridia bacterium]|nr:Cna B-type domain-containing protein [Clostridia bacterium]
MKKLGNTLGTIGRRRLMPLLLACLMLLGMFQPGQALAERQPADYVFTDYADGYHLKSFLNGYNVLSFGNTYLGLHCIGALLVQGDYDGGSGNSGFADGENMPPSYIKGHLSAPNSVYNSRNHRVDPLYVGSSNTVTVTESWGQWYYNVNGLNTGNNSTTPVYVSDNFFNFAQAYAVVKQNQQSMLAGSTVVEPDENGCVTIEIGSHVTISTLEGVREINLTGDLTADASTTINILDDGDIEFPSKYVNGKHPAVVEQAEDGTSIVWNFVNADSVHLPTQNWIGHVIAPDADVSQDSGNYNGCIICHNLYSSAEGHLYNYASDETSWSTVFSVSKVWNDGNDADGVRPDHINVQLLANGRPHGKHVRLEERTGWFYVWTDLPETDAHGNKIVYSVHEAPVPGYTSAYDQNTQTLINTHEYETVDISGTKTWLNEWGWSRPWSITVRLYADGEEVASQVVNTSYWGGWNSYTFSDLPKYKEGREIVYTIHEDPVPGYIGQNNGYNLINTYGVQPITVSGTKKWEDNSNADGLRPEQVTVQLLADGKVIEEHVVSAGNGWKYTFSNLPEYNEAGQKITYSVREKETPRGYTAEVDGYDITNRHEPETVTVSGGKTWNDDNNNDGKRPDSITIVLLGNMAEVARKTVTAADGWKWTFTDLPKNAAGTPIRYSVKEYVPDGYTSKVSGMDIVNTHENETIDLNGSKTWNDNEDAAGKRPESIVIRLWRDGKEAARKTVTAADNWTWSFTDLPKYEAGKEIVYTITEDAVDGYTSTVMGYDVTNEFTEELVEVSGAKTWNDNNNQDGKRPTSITINLLANGAEIAEKTVTASDNWTWNFTDLPKFEAGKEIVYTIT